MLLRPKVISRSETLLEILLGQCQSTSRVIVKSNKQTHFKTGEKCQKQFADFRAGTPTELSVPAAFLRRKRLGNPQEGHLGGH